jgi:Protein of unknown function (DUF1631)
VPKLRSESVSLNGGIGKFGSDMNRNDLLAATRDQFLRDFSKCVPAIIDACVNTLYTKAEKARSSADERRYLDVRTVLTTRGSTLKPAITKSLEKLLHRSFQTAYNNMQQSGIKGAKLASLSLVETSAVDFDMRLDNITKSFRDVAGNELRDLNIRIALLFLQENIKERENPFRPYLLARGLRNATETLGLGDSDADLLSEELSEALRPHVNGIYAGLNELMSDHGIGAELKLKVRKSIEGPSTTSPITASPNTTGPTAAQLQSDARAAAQADAEAAIRAAESRTGPILGAPYQPPRGDDGGSAAQQQAAQQASQQAAQLAQHAASRQRIESFINWVRHPDQPVPTIPPAGFAGAASSSAPATNGGGGASYVSQGAATFSGASARPGDNAGGGATAGINQAGEPFPTELLATPLEDAGPFSLPLPPSAGNAAPGLPNEMPYAGPTPTRSWTTGVQAIGTTFRRLFSFGSESALGIESTPLALESEAGSAPDIAMTGDLRKTSRPGSYVGTQRAISPKLMQSVRDFMQHPPSAEEMSAGDSGIRNLIMERREALAAVTEDISEQMTIDVVAMLFEFILRDTDVPSETRAQLGRLQFLVLKVALRDIEFFTHQSHPARMLVNRVGSLAHGLKQVDPNGQLLNLEVCRIVEVLLADEKGDVGIFSEMVDELDRFVANQLRSEREEIELAVQAMESVESRTLKFARITSAIAEALSFLKVDINLQRLLVDTWANVVEIVERHQPEDTQRFRQLVPDLVWSVAPKVDKADRALMITMLPAMLRTLREGMTLLNWDLKRQADELAWLIENHTYALRAIPVATIVPPLSMIREKFKSFVEYADEDVPADGQGTRDERRLNTLLFLDAGREFGTNLNVIDQLLASDPDVAEPAEPVTPTAEEDADQQEIFTRLRAGVRIMLQLVGEPRPAHLTWVSPSATSIMLTFDNTDKSFVVSVRMFLRLLATHRASFLDGEPLFERAVRKLLESADDMDRANQTF